MYLLSWVAAVLWGVSNLSPTRFKREIEVHVHAGVIRIKKKKADFLKPYLASLSDDNLKNGI